VVELKGAYYGALSLLYRGLQSEQDGKWGDRVAFYKAALDKLNEAVKVAKGLDKTDVYRDLLICCMY
jgi:tyrosine-protein phosphatase non-receptor type 23